MPRELATTSGDGVKAGDPIPSTRSGKHIKDLPMGKPDQGFVSQDVRRHDELIGILKEIRDELRKGSGVYHDPKFKAE